MRQLQEVMRRLLTWNDYLYVQLYKGYGWRQKGRSVTRLTGQQKQSAEAQVLVTFSLIVTHILEQIHTHRSRVVILPGEGLNLYKNPRVNLPA